MLFLLTKVAVWLLFWTLRYTPIVGARLSNAYSDRVFTPVADDIGVVEVTAGSAEDGGGTGLRFTLRNDSWVDVAVDGLDVRIGRSADGATIRNITWAPAFDRPPKNVERTRIRSGEEGTVAIEFFEPTGADDPAGGATRAEGENGSSGRDGGNDGDRDGDGGGAATDATTADADLHVDGSFVFEYSFSVRGHRFSFGDRGHPLPSTTVDR